MADQNKVREHSKRRKKNRLLLIKERCNQCGDCVRICHKGARIFDIDKKEMKDVSSCNLCLLCVTVCPQKALQVIR